VEADRKLNETYKKIMANLKKKADDYNAPRVDDVRAVHGCGFLIEMRRSNFSWHSVRQ
jgi:uncharacterized protein YecT (DUF1311 family)